jgi:hypothetical protein
LKTTGLPITDTRIGHGDRPRISALKRCPLAPVIQRSSRCRRPAGTPESRGVNVTGSGF